NGSDVSKTLLDRVMYNVETLPPLGKEYWWFLFFGQDGENPVQIMLLIFRKYGKKMWFNNKEMVFRALGKNKFQAVTAGWVYDGEELRDLGETNAIVEIQEKKIVSEISGQKMRLSGSFPNYELNVGDLINLEITKGNYLEDKDACGVFLPPFGVGWVDVFSDVDGFVLGKKFKGTAHLQKVVGAAIFGPFHWGRIVSQNGSSISFFCLKTGKSSKTYFHTSATFHDVENNKIIRFDNPKLKMSKRGNNWVIVGKDYDKTFRIVLETYAIKQYDMRGGGSQTYIEYGVTPKEFNLKTKDRMMTLEDVGEGVGTFEDAYW
ncbi:MAG: hypothetical protein U9O90_02950, partial [Euryarchaeota archaeon]|nr:hypothetical protein [Euryarchaeota archaeon]